MNIELDPIIAKVRELAEKYPDTVYPEENCSYSSGKCGEGAGCLLGQAFKAVNPEVYSIMVERFDQNKSIQQVFDYFHIPRSTKTQWLYEVQSKQDDKVSWGFAVKHSDELSPLNEGSESI